MAGQHVLKSIRDTYLYQQMNSGDALDRILKSVIGKGIILTPDKLSYEVNTINRYYKYPLKKQVLDAYENGMLKPLVLPKGVNEKIPASIPFILTTQGAYVFIDNYKSYAEKDNIYSIDPKKLYCLLESAYMAIVINKNFSMISRSNQCCFEAASIYAHMFIRVLNKKYALNVDRRAYSKVLYLAAKFFMVNLLSLDYSSSTVNNYALKVSDEASPFIMNELDSKLTADDFKDLASFILAIKKNSYSISQSLAELTMRDFITDFVAMYQSSSILALEHFSYFMFLIDSVIVGAYLNNQAILEDIVDKSGIKVYTMISNYH